LTEHCCPTATFSTTNPNKNPADANPDQCGQKPLTNRLSHVTTIYVLSNETYPHNWFKIRRAMNTRMVLFRDSTPHTLVTVTNSHMKKEEVYSVETSESSTRLIVVILEAVIS
jgi:hypothetical protein